MFLKDFGLDKESLITKADTDLKEQFIWVEKSKHK